MSLALTNPPLTPPRRGTGQPIPLPSSEGLGVGSRSQCTVARPRGALHEPQGTAGILPAEGSENSPADETSAAPCWRHCPICWRFRARYESACPSNPDQPWESGAEDARTPDADAWSADLAAREAFGVRPIYRRFPSSAGRSAVHCPTMDADNNGRVLSTNTRMKRMKL